MLFYCLLIAGFTLLSMALRSFDHWLPVRLGNLCLLLTSYLLGWLLTGSHFGGAGCVALWFLLPWIDLVTRVRRLEMPVIHTIEAQAPPGSTRFPALDEITEEIELLGFQQVEDAGWSHEEQSQFVRVFSHPKEHVRATISLVENEEISFFYVTLCSRSADGRVWFTWNYPFSTTLKNPRNWHLQRLQEVESFLELMERHRKWLTEPHAHGRTGTGTPLPSRPQRTVRRAAQNRRRPDALHLEGLSFPVVPVPAGGPAP